MARREYAGGAIATTLSGGINSTDLTIAITTATGWPTGATGKFYIAIGRGTATEEKILALSRSGTTITVAATGDRGVDGTTAQSHSAGAAIEHVGTAVDLNDSNAHIFDTTRDDHTQYIPVATGAGAGLTIASRILAVNTDNTTVEVNADTVRVKDGGITSAKIADGAIVNADVNASAAIAYSKLNLATSIVNADIGTSAAIAYSKLALGGNVVNADVNASAAIAYSKLNLSGGIVNADVNAAAAIAYSKLNLAGSVVAADMATAFWSQFNVVQRTTASSQLTVTATTALTAQAIPGTIQTVAITRAGQIVVIHGVIDVEYTGGGTRQEAVTNLWVDGAGGTGGAASSIIGYGDISSVKFRVTPGQVWSVSGLSVGNHTFELRALKLNSGDTVKINQDHTTLTTVRYG